MQLKELQRFILDGKIKWPVHCLERMGERDISRKDVKNSLATHVVNYQGCIIVIKNVPCEECEQCGEKYYNDEVAERLEVMVNHAKQLMQEISVIDYTKVA